MLLQSSPVTLCLRLVGFGVDLRFPFWFWNHLVGEFFQLMLVFVFVWTSYKRDTDSWRVEGKSFHRVLRTCDLVGGYLACLVYHRTQLPIALSPLLSQLIAWFLLADLTQSLSYLHSSGRPLPWLWQLLLLQQLFTIATWFLAKSKRHFRNWIKNFHDPNLQFQD